jgi:xanthine dehydrogenase YagR molybdenum-binding subunit
MADRDRLRERDPYQRLPGGAARITIDKTGHATVQVPANDMGMGTSTTQTIITAERLGLPLERVTVAHGDSSFPGSFLAGGSSQTASIGGAVIAAQRTLVEQLLALADDDSPLAGVASAADPGETQTYSMHSVGAVFCEVRVNAVTGEAVDRMLGSYDCGRIINRRDRDHRRGRRDRQRDLQRNRSPRP